MISRTWGVNLKELALTSGLSFCLFTECLHTLRYYPNQWEYYKVSNILRVTESFMKNQFHISNKSEDLYCLPKGDHFSKVFFSSLNPRTIIVDILATSIIFLSQKYLFCCIVFTDILFYFFIISKRLLILAI